MRSLLTRVYGKIVSLQLQLSFTCQWPEHLKPPPPIPMPDCGVHYLWFAFVCFLIRSHPPHPLTTTDAMPWRAVQGEHSSACMPLS